MLELLKESRNHLIQNWEKASEWGKCYTGGSLCLYDMAHVIHGSLAARKLAKDLNQQLGFPPGIGVNSTPFQETFISVFDQPGGRERILNALDQLIAKAEEHEVPGG